LIRRDLTRLGLASVLMLPLFKHKAMAALPFLVVRQPAAMVHDPDRAVLLGVTRAGNRLVAGGEHGVIVYSDDNGTTWHQAKVPVDIVITSLAFATPQVGWATADYGVILHTADAGASWQVQLEGDAVLTLMNAAAQQYAQANPNAPDAARAQRRAQIFTAAGAAKPFFCVAAISDQEAIVYGAYRMVVVTKDGGKTWSDYSLNIPDPISHNIYDAEWIGASLFLAAESGTLLRSDDKGVTYTLLNSPTQTTFLSICDVGGNAILACGVAGTAYRSTDNGQSWTQVNVATNSDLTSAIKVNSGKVIMLAVSGAIFVSSDQGATFTEATLIEQMLLFDVVQAENQDIVFVGSGGVQIVPDAAIHI